MGKGIARFAPLTGLLTVVLGAVTFILASTWADEPGSKATGAEVAAWLTDKSWQVIVVGWLWLLTAAAFLWFLGSLRVVLARGEGGERRVTAIAWSAGLAATVAFAMWAVPLMGAASMQENDGRTLTPTAAEAMFVLSNGSGFYFVVEIAAGVLALATAIVTLRSGALPKWYGWLGLLYGVVLLIIPIGWAAMIGFPIWILLTTLLVWKAESASGAQAGATA